jgi:hypothetical protein
MSTWVVAGLLAYICLVLTSISGKLDDINSSGMQIAIADEVKAENFPQTAIKTSLYQEATTSSSESIPTWMIIPAVLSIFISWHMARVYYTHQWTHRLLRKTYAHYNHPLVTPKSRDLIHPDQDCVGDPPRADGRIKNSWLPLHAQPFRSSCMLSQD